MIQLEKTVAEENNLVCNFVVQFSDNFWWQWQINESTLSFARKSVLIVEKSDSSSVFDEADSLRP